MIISLTMIQNHLPRLLIIIDYWSIEIIFRDHLAPWLTAEPPLLAKDALECNYDDYEAICLTILMTMMHCSTMVIGLKWWCRCSEYWSVCWPQSLKVKLKECWLMIHVGYRVFLKKQSSFLWPTHLNLAVSVYKETIHQKSEFYLKNWPIAA